ncbi:MAG: fatty-acyl-CoA synthase [Alphaproteobacteria bacterium]|jgi:acyl-CoA synthetase (AMP-forming)/AMP-acid ligase II
MLGLIMDRPLLISSLLDYAASIYGAQEIVSRTTAGDIHRYTYRDADIRVRRMARALSGLGVETGDRIATLAWNDHRHYELYFATSGMGAICHTLNPRLHPGQLTYIMNHAADSYLFIDPTFLELLGSFHGDLDNLKGVIVMANEADMPTVDLPNVYCYETLIGGNEADFEWPEFDENTASSLCYTSGTTGNPKGVLYSHRGTVLHSMAVAWPSVLHLSAHETVLPVVPMFHANAWGIPYAATMTGAKLVLPGAHLIGEPLYELLDGEGVTMTAGVPTIWLALLEYMRANNRTLESVQRMVIGGSAAPTSMIEAFQNEYGAEVRHGWGMTEMSPVGSINTVKPNLMDLPTDARLKVQGKQGQPVYGVDMKITSEDGAALPHDGESFGELKVRGLWVCSGYFGMDESDAHDADGWFNTNDVATIDSEGYMQIVDRKKDVIKSGGEWISSIDLEDLALRHPDVAQAAVIGVPHPKWDERPLLLVTAAPGATPDKDDILAFFKGKIANWWTPDEVLVVDSLPIGGTGKIQKGELREQYSDYKLPSA